MSDNVCPVCGAVQMQSLLCSSCCDRLERNLAAVRGIVNELATTTSKQARIGTAGKPGPAHERSPLNWGASQAADNLGDVLVAWASEILMHPMNARGHNPTLVAAANLTFHIDAVRKHPKVAELVDEIADALTQARRAIDRPADRQYLGQCLVEQQNEHNQWVTCLAEVWAKPEAQETACRECGITHDVQERRAWLLLQASDMLVTAKEAARYIGEVGHIRVTEASIRSYIHRERIAYRPGTKTLRLGDLLDVLTDKAAA